MNSQNTEHSIKHTHKSVILISLTDYHDSQNRLEVLSIIVHHIHMGMMYICMYVQYIHTLVCISMQIELYPIPITCYMII